MRQNFPMPVFGLFMLLVLVSTGRTQDCGTWEMRVPMPVYRQELATGALTGMLYVLGGSDQVGNSTATVEVYNPVTDTWTFTHALMRLITTRLLWQEENSTVSAPEQERPMFMIRTATLGLQRLPACYASYERDA